MKKLMISILLLSQLQCFGSNQTSDLSPIKVNAQPPFDISIQRTNITVPGGIHSGAKAQYGPYVLYLAGRTNGLHAFTGSEPFPPAKQNTNIFVIDLHKKKVFFRSLHDASSGLTQEQIDTLSVTSPQSYQSGNTLYITGGYGVETKTGDFSTKKTLTAINVPKLIDWVTHAEDAPTAAKYIRQISDPIFQVTGGDMFQFGQHPTLLMVGQKFTGVYTTGSNGEYTRQIRRFNIIDDGKKLGVKVLSSTPQNPNYRRRDLNIIPIIKKDDGKKVPAYVILSGVFTPSFGIWTVPVEVTADGKPSMADPNLPTTFKQGMNNYTCAHVELLAKNGSMYSILFGGITFGFFENGIFKTDSDIPFTNQVTTIERGKKGTYTQYLMPVEYPVILSTQSNPGNRLLFGAGADFVPKPNIPQYGNSVLKFKKIKERTTIGYIIGGIQSTMPNTGGPSDSAASPYVFKVTLTPRRSRC